MLEKLLTMSLPYTDHMRCRVAKFMTENTDPVLSGTQDRRALSLFLTLSGGGQSVVRSSGAFWNLEECRRLYSRIDVEQYAALNCDLPLSMHISESVVGSIDVPSYRMPGTILVGGLAC